MSCDISIVVVDDDRPTRNLLAAIANTISGNISAFSDCWSAWMHIKSNPVDLVVSDVYMSGMNGFDLLKSIKQSYPRTRCVMISGDKSVEADLMEMGADAFLSKPFAVGNLLGALRDLSPAIGLEQTRPAESSQLAVLEN